MTYLRLPHIHGDLLCFVAEDDLWLAPLNGLLDGRAGRPARAWRVTVDRSKVGHPRFSPDGTLIAYTTWRGLVPEVHVVPVDGGPGQRLTYWGSSDARVCGWAPPDAEGDTAGNGPGEVLAVSSHDQPFSHRTWAYRLPLTGAPGDRQPWGPVADVQITDEAAEGNTLRRTLLLDGTPPHEPASWKRYRGGATGRLWLDGERLLKDIGGHLHSPMFVGGRIAFLSDHEGVGNLYSCAYDGSGLRRHTDHDAFYARHAASDGTRVVYQCAGDLWMVDDLSPDAKPHPLDVRLAGPSPGRRTYQVPAVRHLEGAGVDETGRASAVVVRGSLYWLTHRDGPARALADTPGVRVRLPEMLGTGGRIAYVTDAEGEDAVEITYLPRATGAPEPLRMASGRLGRVLELVADPQGERLAIASHDGRLLLLAVPGEDGGVPEADLAPAEEAGTETGTEARTDEAGAETDTKARTDDATPEATPCHVTELVRSDNGPVRDLAFSPDGAWLTWSHPWVGRSLRKIKLARIKDRMVVDVTNGRFEDESPAFTRDGRYLAFLSWRGFDPVYDVHTGDLSFPLGCRPYLVPLSSATPSPFAVSPDGRPAAGGLDPAEEPAGEEVGEGSAVTVETEGLESRVTPFPVSASKYSSLRPVAGGGVLWLRWPISGALGETFASPTDISGRPSLEYFDIAKAKKTELVADLDFFAVSGDGTRVVLLDEGDVRAVPATESGDSDTSVWIDLRRIMHEVDPGAEWRQAYEEAGRLTRAFFWEPGMCNIDWDAVLAQYRPLVDRVATPDDFADLLREVLGELGTSHAYVTAARRNEGPAQYQRWQGQLGADFARRAEGWVVERILPGESSDSRARSPLAGTGIREGAVLTHVEGRPVDPVTGPFPLLAAAGGTTVELTFAPAEGCGAPRRVAVQPLIDDRQLRYQDWVAERRLHVREFSGGRCGYLHIPDMGGSGWAQFNRDLRSEMSMPALIVDVRGNAGGHISELVVEALTRSILGWDLTRNAQPVSYATNAPRGPVVALADEATSSDGDMITAAFKLLKLGPVVGWRTWGGVVGMTGRHRLGDGTVITVPMNAAWFDAYGWSVENHGVAPDVEILHTPDDWVQLHQAQLKEAVRIALDLLKSKPPMQPPGYGEVPDRSRPALPPRG